LYWGAKRKTTNGQDVSDIPLDDTLRKNLSISGPALLRKITRPTSIGTEGAWVMTLRASLTRKGIFRLLVKSDPVPEGKIPSVVLGLMISSWPDLIASRAISIARRGLPVNS
jgi:hypothetical protein